MRHDEHQDRSTYQDALRAVGLILDERGYGSFRLVQSADGFIVQARRAASGPSNPWITMLISEQDVREYLARAEYQRTTGDHQAKPARPTFAMLG
jgi:hypothetical protein